MRFDLAHVPTTRPRHLHPRFPPRRRKREGEANFLSPTPSPASKIRAKISPQHIRTSPIQLSAISSLPLPCEQTASSLALRIRFLPPLIHIAQHIFVRACRSDRFLLDSISTTHPPIDDRRSTFFQQKWLRVSVEPLNGRETGRGEGRE